MKLNPPGSSSDLEAARATARRLHQRTFASEPTPPVRARREPWEVPPPARDPLPLHRTVSAPASESASAASRGHEPRPFVQAQVDREPAGSLSEPEPALDLDPAPLGADSEETPPAWSEGPAGPPGAPWDGDGEDSGVEPEDALAELTDETDEPSDAISPEDLVSEPAPPPAWPEAPALDVDSETGPGPTAEDLVEVVGPSWDDVADSCLGLAHARGAMLVDGAGRVLAARGDWPNPGPEAIAGRLVPMMERALRDAPSRSVSAPLAGQHLTAWRVPVGEAVLTAVFMGDAPLRADVRPAIDQEIGRADIA
jgi:hypothetical protein